MRNHLYARPRKKKNVETKSIKHQKLNQLLIISLIIPLNDVRKTFLPLIISNGTHETRSRKNAPPPKITQRKRSLIRILTKISQTWTQQQRTQTCIIITQTRLITIITQTRITIIIIRSCQITRITRQITHLNRNLRRH